MDHNNHQQTLIGQQLAQQTQATQQQVQQQLNQQQVQLLPPQTPPPPQAPPQPPLMVQDRIFQVLAENQQELICKHAAALQPSYRVAVKAPKSFNGKFGPEACNFLVAFFSYVLATGPTLNVRKNGKWAPNHKKWIKAALLYLTGLAATWARLFCKQLVNHCGDRNKPSPFVMSWNTFMVEFQCLFKPADSVQGFEVAPYAAAFRELALQTGLSDANHLCCFKSYLSLEVKDMLLAVPLAEQNTLSGMIGSAILVGERLKTRELERAEERARSQGGFGFGRTNTTTAGACGFFNTFTPSTPRAPAPAAINPMVMDINALYVNTFCLPVSKEFLCAMSGWCYGCGSRDHIKRDGNHERNICKGCGKPGHRCAVCYREFLARHQAAPGTASHCAPQAAPAVPYRVAAAIAAPAAPATTPATEHVAALCDQIAIFEAEMAANPNTPF
ncbi:hypothetical protein BDV98DRAFT_589776 [Pterulicium gracile]|uniref:CCHC-type domain-containing protein n=1 Tax=Pterulicium gracile TaxID=1884261 RepID=A0A5C3QST9_9AGAR|nr:hypothetical protein BDV98DRAFT_589776 [Pterula gracilis]